MTTETITVDREVTIPDGTKIVSTHEDGFVRTATEEEAEPVLLRGTGNSSFVAVPFGAGNEVPIHGHSAATAAAVASVEFWGPSLGEVVQFSA